MSKRFYTATQLMAGYISSGKPICGEATVRMIYEVTDELLKQELE